VVVEILSSLYTRVTSSDRICNRVAGGVKAVPSSHLAFGDQVPSPLVVSFNQASLKAAFKSVPSSDAKLSTIVLYCGSCRRAMSVLKRKMFG